MNSQKQTLLLLAAWNGHESVVRLLLLLEKEGVDVSSKDKDGGTPLWWATANKHVEIVKLLPEKEGVDVNSKDKDS
jgi:ankyrin repeat protein